MTAAQPRSMFKLFWRFTGWLVLMPLLVGTITTLIAMYEGRKAERLEEGGVVTQATIVNKDITVTVDSDGDRKTTYTLSFIFEHERRTLADEDNVGRRFYNSLSIGDQTPLRYWLQNPMVNEIEPGSTTLTIWVTKIISVVMLVFAGFWAERCWRKARRSVRVRDHGVRRRAEVIGHIATNVRVNGVYRSRLEWRDEAGGTGRSFWIPTPRTAEFPIGHALFVYADPQGRLPAVWEQDVGPARAQGAVRR